MRIFQGERIAALMDKLGVEEDQPIENRAVSKTLESAQKRVEGYNYDTRKNVVQYDNVINRHRRVVYKIRREILEGENIRPEIDKLVDAKIKELTIVPAKNNLKFAEQFESIIPIKFDDIKKIGEEKKDKPRYELAIKFVNAFYTAREKELGVEIIRGVERDVYLQVLDVLWMQHLENMQHLRDGIHWRSVGQRDPLVEYRQESQKLFESLQRTLRDEVLRAIFHVKLQEINAPRITDEVYETDLTRAAQSSVEQGVNEAGIPSHHGDDDFKVKKAKAVTAKKKEVQKKRKATRVSRKRK